MQAYASAKLRLFENLADGDLAVLPHEDAHLKRPSWHREACLNAGWVHSPDASCTKTAWTSATPCWTCRHFHFRQHNRSNLEAALLARHAGVSRSCPTGRSPTASPPHGATCTPMAGVAYINDSKATNVEAALVGIQASQRRISPGWPGKSGADYRVLAPDLRSRARRVICFGSAGPDISAQLADAAVTRLRTPLPDALRRARAVSFRATPLLLSRLRQLRRLLRL